MFFLNALSDSRAISPFTSVLASSHGLYSNLWKAKTYTNYRRVIMDRPPRGRGCLIIVQSDVFDFLCTEDDVKVRLLCGRDEFVWWPVSPEISILPQ